MPVPYRKTPKAAEEGSAAYLDVVYLRSTQTFYAALLLLDGRGQPLEFLHNHLTAPSGFLWPEERVAAFGAVELAHSLFAACRRDPDLLICPAALGSPEFCRNEIAPSLPFAQITPGSENIPDEWTWINEPPAPGMRANGLAQELQKRGFLFEPFQRIRYGLKEIYPDAPWAEARG